MKIRYEIATDVAYIEIADDENRSAFGFTYACDPLQVDGQIHLDFDSEGRLFGIEVLNASERLPRAVLSAALKPSKGN
jgi:uncharacterized protein YuzE